MPKTREACAKGEKEKNPWEKQEKKEQMAKKKKKGKNPLTLAGSDEPSGTQLTPSQIKD